MKRNLEFMNIKSIKDLAHASPERLHRKFGIMGLQLYHHANGIDRSKLQNPMFRKERTLGTVRCYRVIMPVLKCLFL